MLLPTICLTYTKFSDWKFFLANDSNFDLPTLTVIRWELFTRSNRLDDMSFQSTLLITLLVSMTKSPYICYIQPRSLSLGKSRVFPKKSNHPAFIKISLVFHFFASSNDLVISTHKTFFVIFMITAWHNSCSNPIWDRS